MCSCISWSTAIRIVSFKPMCLILNTFPAPNVDLGDLGTVFQPVGNRDNLYHIRVLLDDCAWYSTFTAVKFNFVISSQEAAFVVITTRENIKRRLFSRLDTVCYSCERFINLPAILT